MLGKIFFWVNLVLYIAVSEFIAYIYFSIFKYFQPPMLSPGAFGAAQMYYYAVGAVIGVLAFILMAFYTLLQRKLHPPAPKVVIEHKNAPEPAAKEEEKK